ncbi:MAG: hypothetical protein COB42_08190 [Sulfurimonas sp.]|nr:MAG: hypothetical protein COB42_08190 [Sulfurimonas sp.]
MSKKYLSIVLEPLLIGVTKKTKKRVWLETKVTIRYEDGTTSIDVFDTNQEAEIFANEVINKAKVC